MHFIESPREQCPESFCSGLMRPPCSVAWYTLDNGLFLTGGFDGTMQLWDTNSGRRVRSVPLIGKVYSLAMAPRATSHALVAAAIEGGEQGCPSAYPPTLTLSRFPQRHVLLEN